MKHAIDTIAGKSIESIEAWTKLKLKFLERENTETQFRTITFQRARRGIRGKLLDPTRVRLGERCQLENSTKSTKSSRVSTFGQSAASFLRASNSATNEFLAGRGEESRSCGRAADQK